MFTNIGDNKSKKVIRSESNLLENSEKIEESAQQRKIDMSEKINSRSASDLIQEIEGISEIELEFILKGISKGRVFKFTDSSDSISIGRDEECTIAINDPFVSVLHGVINFTRNSWIYTDSISSNKSWIGLNHYKSFCNKIPSPPLKLRNGQQVKLGNIDFSVEICNFD